MSRPKNNNDPEKVHPTLSRQMLNVLDQMKEMGLYGSNRSEVARYLIQRGIDDLMRTGIIKVKG